MCVRVCVPVRVGFVDSHLPLLALAGGVSMQFQCVCVCLCVHVMLCVQASAQLRTAQSAGPGPDRDALVRSALQVLRRVPKTCNLEQLTSELAYLKAYAVRKTHIDTYTHS